MEGEWCQALPEAESRLIAVPAGGLGLLPAAAALPDSMGRNFENQSRLYPAGVQSHLRGSRSFS